MWWSWKSTNSKENCKLRQICYWSVWFMSLHDRACEREKWRERKEIKLGAGVAWSASLLFLPMGSESWWQRGVDKNGIWCMEGAVVSDLAHSEEQYLLFCLRNYLIGVLDFAFVLSNTSSKKADPSISHQHHDFTIITVPPHPPLIHPAHFLIWTIHPPLIANHMLYDYHHHRFSRLIHHDQTWLYLTLTPHSTLSTPRRDNVCIKWIIYWALGPSPLPLIGWRNFLGPNSIDSTCMKERYQNNV